MALFRRKPRDDESSMQALATDLGLTYLGREVDDAEYRRLTGGLPDLPLIRQGSPTHVSFLMYGNIGEIPTQIFNFDVSGREDDPDHMHRSCVALTVRARLPHVYVSPRDRLPRLGEKLSASGISFGSVELLKRYRIQARSPEHVAHLFGPEAEQWLLDCAIPKLSLEIGDRSILAHAPDLPGAEEIRPLLEFVQGMHKRVPEQTWTTYRLL